MEGFHVTSSPRIVTASAMLDFFSTILLPVILHRKISIIAAMVLTTCAIECAQCRENPLLVFSTSRQLRLSYRHIAYGRGMSNAGSDTPKPILKQILSRLYQRTSHSFDENQPMHRKRNFLKSFCNQIRQKSHNVFI